MTGVLVGVDGSPSSKRAAMLAAEGAKHAGRDLLVAHVIPWSPYSFTSPAEIEHRSKHKDAELKSARAQVIDPILAIAADFGVTAETFVRHGDPVDLLIDLARERDLDQIVVGRTGDSRLKRALFGSIPAHLVQEAPVPVTVVP